MIAVMRSPSARRSIAATRVYRSFVSRIRLTCSRVAVRRGDIGEGEVQLYAKRIFEVTQVATQLVVQSQSNLPPGDPSGAAPAGARTGPVHRLFI